MAIARTPAVVVIKPISINEKEIEALINKGGSSTPTNELKTTEEDDVVKTVLLRTYESQVREIDDLLAQIPKRKRPSRNVYIIEAINERLQRDKVKRK